MTAPKLRRGERRLANQRAHYAARAERKPGDPLGQVSAATDRARQVIKRAPDPQARHIANVITRAVDAALSSCRNESRRAR